MANRWGNSDRLYASRCTRPSHDRAQTPRDQACVKALCLLTIPSAPPGRELFQTVLQAGVGTKWPPASLQRVSHACLLPSLRLQSVACLGHPQLSLATRGEDWASQGQPKGKAEIPVVTRECRLFATPWTVAYQAPLSMGFSRQKYWSGKA